MVCAARSFCVSRFTVHTRAHIYCRVCTRVSHYRYTHMADIFLDTAVTLLVAAAVIAVIDYARDCSWITYAKPLRITGRVVVITGAAGGLGRELALQFAQRGAILALWDIREEALVEVKDWLCGQGAASSAIHTRVVDVSDPESVSNAAAEQLQTLGPAHIVVSNAAIVTGQRVVDAQPAQVTRAFGVNVLAHFWCARAFVPQMLQASPHAHADAAGVFATIGSLMAELPAARLADYCASKAAIVQLHECLRWELGGDRGEPRGEVRLLHVQPYLLDTVLFAGGTPFRYAWMRRLVRPLKAATVAHRTVRAIESGSRERLVLPWMFKWLPTILHCLHTGLRDAALVFAGAACAMDGFVGRLPADRKER